MVTIGTTASTIVENGSMMKILEMIMIGVAFGSLMLFHGLLIWLAFTALTFLLSGSDPLTERERKDLIYSEIARRMD